MGTGRKEQLRGLTTSSVRIPILQNPDFEKPFTVTTDASDYAIGAVLSQEKDGMDLPVAYVFRVLVGATLNYSTTEKECVAVLYAVVTKLH